MTRQVIPRRVYRQRRILLYLIGASFHCADCPPQPSGPEPVWRAYLEVVRRELLRHISSKNIGPWATQTDFANTLLSDCNSRSMRRASEVLRPQYLASANPVFSDVRRVLSCIAQPEAT